MGRFTALIALAGVILLTASCGRSDVNTEGGGRGMYYWATTFAIDSAKRDFIDRHRIDRLYVRYFDVVQGDDGSPQPNATIRFDSAVNTPVEIVPVVFIHNDCMRSRSDSLPRLILDRVMKMCDTHHIASPRELQIDCDWTASTRANFFDFLSRLRPLADSRGVALSVTIRLHQLSQPAPPADRGVLMVYNTGDVTDLTVDKPILDPKVVEKYCRHLKDYGLPLATAYPVYRWEVLTRGGRFVDILHYPDELPVLDTDSIVIRQPSVDDILKSRNIIESQRPDCASEIILFDLNNHNLKRYSYEEFHRFFN